MPLLNLLGHIFDSLQDWQASLGVHFGMRPDYDSTVSRTDPEWTYPEYDGLSLVWAKLTSLTHCGWLSVIGHPSRSTPDPLSRSSIYLPKRIALSMC